MTAARTHPLATRDRVRSVSRALAVLDALAMSPDGQTAKGVAAAVGLALPTAYHLLNTLVASGYASRDSASQLFALGPRIPQLHHAYLARSRPSPAVRPFLRALHETTQATVHHYRLFGDDAVLVDLIPGREPPPSGVGYVGYSLPAHLMAAGRALLAWLPPEHRRAYAAGRYGHSAGPFPPADAAHLDADATQIRATGYAIDRGSGWHALCCLAAPIVTATGEATDALAIITHGARFAREEAVLLAALVAISHAASRVADARIDPEGAPQPLISPDLIEAAMRARDIPL